MLIRFILALIGLQQFVSVACADVTVAPEHRLPNKTGRQCVWCAVETCCRHLDVTRGHGLTQRFFGTAGPGFPEAVLSRLGIRWDSRYPGRQDWRFLEEAIANGYPVAVGLRGKHMVTLVGISPKEVRYIENSYPKKPSVMVADRTWFRHAWDGWAIVVYPKAK